MEGRANMRLTLVVALGTAACGAALHFRRRLLRASVDERPALEQRCSELLGCIRILAIDLDGTETYRLPSPIDSEGSGWRVGEAHKVTLNPRDIVERLRSGQMPEVEQV